VSGRIAEGHPVELPVQRRTPPGLADRIVAMRDAGATYRAIADALNADQIPTVRGGGEWRPSSLRSAIMSRRAELLAQRA
jgi:Recombinase